MKKISIFTILSFVFILSVTAQVERSQKPEPGPAPTIQLGDFESFELDNGMKVIVVENDQVPVVSFQLTLDIDPLYEGEAKGYTDLAGSLMREGTANRSKKEIDEAIDFIGGSLSTSSTGMFGSSLTRHQETLLELMSDILLNPSFPEEEMDRLIKQNKSGLATVENNATAMANNVARAVTYGHDHPYGEVTTEESLDNITREQITGYYEDHFKPNVAYMVIVGDMTTEEAQDVMETYFASWEPG
ncbi:MAG: M16 family metallopeptidase, partial [Bacteroidota bacterium]